MISRFRHLVLCTALFAAMSALPARAQNPQSGGIPTANNASADSKIVAAIDGFPLHTHEKSGASGTLAA